MPLRPVAGFEVEVVVVMISPIDKRMRLTQGLIAGCDTRQNPIMQGWKQIFFMSFNGLWFSMWFVATIDTTEGYKWKSCKDKTL